MKRALAVGDDRLANNEMFPFGNQPLSYDSSNQHLSATETSDYPLPPMFYPFASQYRTLSAEQDILTGPSAGIGYRYIENPPIIASDPSIDEQNRVYRLSEYVMPTIPSQTSNNISKLKHDMILEPNTPLS